MASTSKFSADAEFIAFAREELGPEYAAPAAEGQPQLYTKGRKRNAQEMQDEPRHRQPADARQAPWARLVDWDRCKNPAEMSVYTRSPFCLMLTCVDS